MCEKPRISLPIIVEGRYDKSTVLSMFEATVVATDGFGIFNSAEKRALIRKIGAGGIILLTDSDGGGKQIRSYLCGILPKDKVYNLYIPEIAGKEKRKKTRSKAGLLGVEGMSREVLLGIFAPFISDGEKNTDGQRELTRLDMYNDGLSGGTDSSKKRNAVASALGFPSGMSSKALMEAVNIARLYGEYRKIVESFDL